MGVTALWALSIIIQVLMKKSILILIFALLIGVALQAQAVKISLNGGFPIGDFSASNSFVISADGAYVFDIANHLAIGPSVSVVHFFGRQFNSEEFGPVPEDGPLLSNRTIQLDNATFIPVGATTRFSASESFILGVDVGYGIGIAPALSEGGFYYKGQGIYMISNKLGVALSYNGIITNQGTFSSLSLGVEISL